MGDLLQIGASATRAYGAALATVGENVSNANTDGFSRRTISLSAVQSSGAGGVYSKDNAGFNGVRVAGTGRAWDDYLATAQRGAASDSGRATARLTWLGSAESALSDDDIGIGQSATLMFNAGDTLASDPNNASYRNAFLDAVTQTASAFKTTAQQLKTVSDGVAATAETSVAGINSTLDTLGKVNTALRATQSNTDGKADLLDQRDRLLDQLSAQIGIDVRLSGDGSASVAIAGGGPTLVSGTNAGGASSRLTLDKSENGRLSVVVISQGQDVLSASPGGTLGGLVESANVVADRRQQIDSLAQDFATALNAWNAQGTDKTGAAGGALLTGTDAQSLAVATTDSGKIAAANTGASNGNLLTLSALRGDTGVETRWNGITTDQGRLVSAAKSEASAASSRAESTTGARAAVTGVDLDTEAAELMRYQQAYNGAAKVIQVARETMQAILDVL